MPNPTVNDLHVDALLTELSLAFFQKPAHFIAGQVAPTIVVPKKSDKYRIYERGDFNRDEMKKRAPSTESEGSGFRLSDDSFYCDRWAFHKDLDEEEVANDDLAQQTEQAVNEFITTKAMIRREKQFMDSHFVTGVWATDLVGVNAAPGAGQILRWSSANSTPIKDIAEGQATMLEATGFEPNTLVLGYRVWQILKNHADFLDRIEGGATTGTPAQVMLQLLAQLFEVERVLVSKAIMNTADEGQTADHEFIGGKSALLCYVNPNPGPLMPSAAYTFAWNGVPGVNSEGMRISRIPVPLTTSERFEIESYHDQKVVSADLGYFLSGIVA